MSPLCTMNWTLILVLLLVLPEFNCCFVFCFFKFYNLEVVQPGDPGDRKGARAI